VKRACAETGEVSSGRTLETQESHAAAAGGDRGLPLHLIPDKCKNALLLLLGHLVVLLSDY
jgi:hypothetical protein